MSVRKVIREEKLCDYQGCDIAAEEHCILCDNDMCETHDKGFPIDRTYVHLCLVCYSEKPIEQLREKLV